MTESGRKLALNIPRSRVWFLPLLAPESGKKTSRLNTDISMVLRFVWKLIFEVKTNDLSNENDTTGFKKQNNEKFGSFPSAQNKVWQSPFLPVKTTHSNCYCNCYYIRSYTILLISIFWIFIITLKRFSLHKFSS